VLVVNGAGIMCRSAGMTFNDGLYDIGHPYLTHEVFHIPIITPGGFVQRVG
jgi:hypothetical protein